MGHSVPRVSKQRSCEGLHKVSWFMGCLGRAGDAAGQSSWKSNYCFPSKAAEGSSSAADKGTDKRLSEPQIPFQWGGGNVPRVLFFPSGCQHPVLLTSLCWSSSPHLHSALLFSGKNGGEEGAENITGFQKRHPPPRTAS